MKIKIRKTDSVAILDLSGKLMGGPDADVFKDTIKQKKQIAGLLKKDEDQPGSVVVNVKYLQNMMLKAHE